MKNLFSRFVILLILLTSFQPTAEADQGPGAQPPTPWYQSFWKTITFQQKEEPVRQLPEQKSMQAHNTANSSSDQLYRAITYLRVKLKNNASIANLLKSSNSLLEAVAADTQHTNDEKNAFLTALQRLGTADERMGDQEFVNQYLDELLAGSSSDEISKLAWLIVKEKDIIADFPGAAQNIKDAKQQKPLNPIYLANISKNFLNQAGLRQDKQDLFQYKKNQRDKEMIQDMVNGKDDKTRGTAPLGNAAENAIENVRNHKGPVAQLAGCVGAYMDSGGSQPDLGGPVGGGIVNPVGTTIDPNKGGGGGKNPGNPQQHQNPFSQAGKAHSNSHDMCYGVDMTQLNDYISDRGNGKSSINAAISYYKDGNVSKVYSVRDIVTSRPFFGDKHEIIIEEFSVDGWSGSKSLKLDYSETRVVIGDAEAKSAVTKELGEAIEKAEDFAGSEGGVTLYSSTGADADDPISKKEVDKGCGKDCGVEGPPAPKTGGSDQTDQPDAVAADSPCDGEKDHVAFAECIGNSGGSNNPGAISCADYQTCMASGGNNCGGSKVGDNTNTTPCQGDSAAIELYAANPNLPLWDPQHMKADQNRIQQAVMPTMNSMTATPQKQVMGAGNPAYKAEPANSNQSKSPSLMQYLKGLLQKPAASNK